LLLTLAVTIIEVTLIATIMLGDKAVPTLARDTVFAVVMIVCNGLVGACVLAGGLRYREQEFQSCARLLAGNHRSDDSRRRGGRLCHGQARSNSVSAPRR
jgi:hypothetical protein